MKKMWLFLIVLCFSSTVYADLGKIKSAKDYDEALKLAKEQKKPILVMFGFATWPPCKKLAQGAFSDDEVVKTAEKLISVYIDKNGTEREKQVVKMYGVRSYPTLLFLDPNGNKIGYYEGGRDPSSIKAVFEDIAKKYSKDSVTETEVKIAWEDSTEKGAEKSKSTGKLLAVVFLEDTEDKEVLKPLAGIGFVDDYIFVKSKYYKDSELVKKCKVELLPAISLVNTINNTVKTLNGFTSDNLKDFINKGRWDGPRWLTDLKKATNTVKVSEKPLVVLFVNDKETKGASSHFVGKMLESLKDEATWCRIQLSEDADPSKYWGAKKLPACFIVTNAGTTKEKKTQIVNITFTEIRQALKTAISEKVEWKCANIDCGKVYDEPGECCGKKTARMKKGGDKETNPTSSAYFCKGCGKTSNEQKDCCGKPMAKLPDVPDFSLYECEKCGHKARTQKDCCGQPMKLKTQD